MTALTALALRRPRATLAIWGLVIVLLSVAGIGVQQHLGEASIDIPHTQSARAQAIDRVGFGSNEVLPVLLDGPRRQLDRQGHALVTALRRHWSVLSAWDAGASRLRPSPSTAFVIVDLSFARGAQPAARIAPLRAVVAATIRGPVHARISGPTVLSEALTRQTLQSAKTAQFIAIPVLLIVLLLVFRAPFAAAVPMIVGFATVTASAGIIALLGSAFGLTALAVSMAAMMGLALGVDYSLLIVSRFREELMSGDPRTSDPAAAAATAAATAGRTVVFAGVALLIAMLVAVVLSPGNVLVSLTTGVAVAVALSVVSGAAVVPALLMLIGTRIDRWRLGARSVESALLPTLSRVATRKAFPVLLGPLVILLFVAAPALGLRTAPPNPRVLPSSDPARKDFEQIVRLLGYGYITPFEIALQARHGVITRPDALASLARFQRQIRDDPGVAGLIGPGALARRARPAVALPGQIDTFRKQAAQAASGVKRLRIGLGAASAGALQLSDGAAQASAGAVQLGAGARLLDAGAGRLSGALGTAAHRIDGFAQGSQLAAQDAAQLSSGTTAAKHGGEAVLAGLVRLEAGVHRLQQADAQLAAALASGAGLIRDSLSAPAAAADQQLAIAYSALEGMGAGRSDPQYASALAAVASAKAMVAGTNPQTGQPAAASLPLAIQQLTSQTQRAADSAGALSDSAARLLAGVHSVQTGTQALVSNLEQVELGQSAMSLGLAASTRTLAHARAQVGQLAAGARRLASGTQRLSSGIGQLSAIDQIAQGNDTLARNLSEGDRSTAPLERGLRHTAHVIAGIPPLHGLLADGHLVLAGAASAGAAQSSQLSFVLDTAGAGRVARILVFPRTLPIDAAGARLRRLLTRQTARFALAHGMDGALGGPATQLNNFRDAVLSFIPVLILALCVLTYVFLVLILGALILPAVAILLNLVIVAATFGVLTLLFQGSGPVLGGPGFVDAVTVAGVFTVLFALSIDYQVFLLTRMREAYEHERDAEAAILFGIRRTARVVTGAALIMAAVFLSFGSSTFIIPRQFGVGLTVAVLLDAFVLRLFMLPAVMRLLGDRGWWMPALLQRHLPRLKVEG